jgi:hypothetical protein
MSPSQGHSAVGRIVTEKSRDLPACSAVPQPNVEWFWNVMAHAQKPDFVFRRNGRVHLNRRGRQFSRLLAAEVCASALVMLDTPRSEVVWRVLATHTIRQFPLHFPSPASPCAIRFQLDSTIAYPNYSLQEASPEFYVNEQCFVPLFIIVNCTGRW